MNFFRHVHVKVQNHVCHRQQDTVQEFLHSIVGEHFATTHVEDDSVQRLSWLEQPFVRIQRDSNKMSKLSRCAIGLACGDGDVTPYASKDSASQVKIFREDLRDGRRAV